MAAAVAEPKSKKRSDPPVEESTSILSQILQSSRHENRPNLAALFGDREQIPEAASELAKELKQHPTRQLVLKRLERVHLMDALLTHACADCYRDRAGAQAIFKALYCMWGYEAVQHAVVRLRMQSTYERLFAKPAYAH